MKKQLKIYNTLICLILITTTYSQSVRVKFQVAQLSVNVANPTTALMPQFMLIPDTLNFGSNNIDSLDLINFPSINYDDIESIAIENVTLSTNKKLSFSRLATFPTTQSTSKGNLIDKNCIPGATYAFRLTAITKSGQEKVLMNKAVTVSSGTPKINCAKFNTVYRKSCHNCFQDDIISTSSGGIKRALDITRVIELDIYSSKVLGGNNTSGIWNVRHGPKLDNNYNNCGTQGFNISGRSFNICLQDVIEWHNEPSHKGHDPITIFIDLKKPIFGNSAFWRAGHSPDQLDLLLKTVGIQNIYTPKELAGGRNDLRKNAQSNNWPSMGDLKDKFIFILTGGADLVNHYVNELGIDGVAFIAMTSKSKSDAQNLTHITDKDKVVFYNIRGKDPIGNSLDQLDIAKQYTYPNNYISRVTTTSVLEFGEPDNFSDKNYRKTIQFKINCPAPRNITKNFNHTYQGIYFPENGIFSTSELNHISLIKDHIFSSHKNVTQAATKTITATNLIVESGANYRMIAGESITLLPGTELKAGSNVELRIDNCSYADYSLRKASYEELTQEQINALMHELDKDLYTYTPDDEKEIVRLNVYPNPTNYIINISYTNYLLNEAIFTLYDLTGRVIKTKIYSPQNEGLQKFNLNTRTLKNGTYFYTLQVGEKRHNGKIVKIDN